MKKIIIVPLLIFSVYLGTSFLINSYLTVNPVGGLITYGPFLLWFFLALAMVKKIKKEQVNKTDKKEVLKKEPKYIYFSLFFFFLFAGTLFITSHAYNLKETADFDLQTLSQGKMILMKLFYSIDLPHLSLVWLWGGVLMLIEYFRHPIIKELRKNREVKISLSAIGMLFIAFLVAFYLIFPLFIQDTNFFAGLIWRSPNILMIFLFGYLVKILN